MSETFEEVASAVAVLIALAVGYLLGSRRHVPRHGSVQLRAPCRQRRRR